MKRKSKTVPKNLSQAAKKVAKKRTVRQVRSRPIAAGTAAVNQDRFVGVLGELLGIAGDMRDLLVEIRDLLAEGAEQESQAQEEREGGVEAVIVAETEPEEEIE